MDTHGPIVTKSATAVRNSAFNAVPFAVLLAPWIAGLVSAAERTLGVSLGEAYADQLTAAVVAAIPAAVAWYRTRVIDRRGAAPDPPVLRITVPSPEHESR